MDALEVTERSQVGQMEVFEREKKVQEKLHDFIALNAMAKNAGIVCFGSSTFAKMNMLELAMDCGLNVPPLQQKHRRPYPGRFSRSFGKGNYTPAAFKNLCELWRGRFRGRCAGICCPLRVAFA